MLESEEPDLLEFGEEEEEDGEAADQDEEAEGQGMRASATWNEWVSHCLRSGTRQATHCAAAQVSHRRRGDQPHWYTTTRSSLAYSLMASLALKRLALAFRSACHVLDDGAPQGEVAVLRVPGDYALIPFRTISR
jgi:hypothetical protein